MILEWTSLAEKHKASQIDFIAQDNPTAAVQMGDEIERQVEMLLQYPQLGRAGRVKGTRELVINGTPYIVAYRIKGDVVQILGVLHGAQQWPGKFS